MCIHSLRAKKFLREATMVFHIFYGCGCFWSCLQLTYNITVSIFRNMRNVFNHLLVFLCVADMIVILTNLFLSIRVFIPTLLPELGPWSDGICHIAVTGSVFLTIAITVERYYAICSPHTYQTRVLERGHWCIISSYIVPVIVTAVMLNTPKVLHIGKMFSVKSFSNPQTYIKVAILSQVVHPLSTTCVLPVIILAFLNYRILVKSRRLNSSTCRQVISMAKVMMTIVTVFIILSIPKLVFGLYEVSTIPNIMKCHARRCRYYISSMRWVVDSIIRYMGLLNSSVNFIIYCCVGSNFRRTFMTNMRGMWRRREDNDTPRVESSHRI